MDIQGIKILEKDIYQSEDVLMLAQFFLNKYLITNIDGALCITKIVETEAYRAPDDKGSHAYQNKKTKRTQTMFGMGGIAYVYLCYGLHNMFNIVTGPEDTAHAILIRAVEPIGGVKYMSKRRKGIEGYTITNGPGKLCQALGITRSNDSNILFNKRQRVWIGDNKTLLQDEILSGPRVGIAYAEECAHYPWRFRVKGNPWTSMPDEVNY